MSRDADGTRKRETRTQRRGHPARALTTLFLSRNLIAGTRRLVRRRRAVRRVRGRLQSVQSCSARFTRRYIERPVQRTWSLESPAVEVASGSERATVRSLVARKDRRKERTEEEKTGGADGVTNDAMASLRQTPLTCSGHTRPVVHLAFSDVTESGYYLISACKDGKPMLRQGDTGDWIGTFEGHKGAVWGVALNPEATRAATGAADFNAKVWDAIKGEEIHSFQHNHIVKSVNFSTDSNHLCTGSNEKLIRVYDLNKPEAAPQIFSGHASGIRHVTFFDNNSALITCADDKTLRVWDRNSGQEVKRLDFPAIPSSMEVSKDGNVITTTHSNVVSFWDSKELTKIKEFMVPTQVNSASLHPDCTIFVCGGEDFKMYKFDYNTGAEIESFKGHFGPVHCVRFSPDGELYASGSEDGTLRLWQTVVGKTYGLWRCIEQTPTIQENATVINNKQEVPAN